MGMTYSVKVWGCSRALIHACTTYSILCEWCTCMYNVHSHEQEKCTINSLRITQGYYVAYTNIHCHLYSQENTFHNYRYINRTHNIIIIEKNNKHESDIENQNRPTLELSLLTVGSSNSFLIIEKSTLFCFT